MIVLGRSESVVDGALCLTHQYSLKLSLFKAPAWGFPGSSAVKILSAMQETQVRSLGLEDPLEEGMETHSSILAWGIPRTEERGWHSPWGHKELGMTEVTEYIGMQNSSLHTADSRHCTAEANTTL